MPFGFEEHCAGTVKTGPFHDRNFFRRASMGIIAIDHYEAVEQGQAAARAN